MQLPSFALQIHVIQQILTNLILFLLDAIVKKVFYFSRLFRPLIGMQMRTPYINE